MYGSFSPEALQFWDFVRCQRPNGTFYGTSGRCKSGVQVSSKPQKLSGSLLGAGKESKVYDIGRDRALKVSTANYESLETHQIASQLGVAPRLYAHGKMRDGRNFQIVEKVKTSDIHGLGQPGSRAKEIEDLDENQLFREKEAYKASLKLNAGGVAHGDLHGGNIKWDENNQKAILLDFDNATKSWKDARAEAASTLNTIGIRLENSGYYDEADEVYSKSSIISRISSIKMSKAIEETSGLLDSVFPG